MKFTTSSSAIAFGLLLFITIPWLAGPALADAAASPEAATLHALLDQEWEWTLQEFPEFATNVGDNRYNDKLTDLSASAMERRKAHEREVADRIREINRARLAGQDVVSYDLFRLEAERSVARQRFPLGKIPAAGGFVLPLEWEPVSPMHGVHLDIPSLPRRAPFRNAKDYRDFLSRLAAYPRQIDEVIELMQRGIASGWVAPAVPMRRVPAQIEAQLVDDPTKSPLYKAFEKFPESIGEQERAQLAAKGREAITVAIVPALKHLHQFIVETYLPAGRKDIAASSLPGGQAYYELAVRNSTTTDLPVSEIHETGKREVVRIRKEMDAIMKRVGFEGSFAAFLQFLRSDPRFYYARGDEILPGYRDIAKRVDPELPKLFAELPRTPYGIREIPSYEGETAERYSPGTADGTRAGFFNAYIGNPAVRPKFAMEDLFLHEAVPGHHLQIARAQEIKGLPHFRRNGWYIAYGEGWALYAESLGEELGLYSDPYSKFGQLDAEIFRAARLVVDTGIHAFGWSRQQAIDYMRENSGLAESFIESEVDRYIVWPGQALGYKIGELKIKALRAKAQQALGAKFDLRRFHNALLDDGALPLDLLERRIDEWIKMQQ
jgi:uncharacterized protein (DUF885 family)